ncbi:hypothetical protein [Mycolicibacterium goodii]|uniref:hypothetical protein n=1 Tax=Mycolicibacterium goodii TaxID=134601 RepID=UPI001BDC123B|nr:hypothetical protein [Mycolicibacterium goodii]MBU8834142.1 hypothetical protein [Mycolicibacterium goodii]
MSNKLTCPRCGEHSSRMFIAYAVGRPCPHCNAPLGDAKTAAQYYRQLPDDHRRVTNDIGRRTWCCNGPLNEPHNIFGESEPIREMTAQTRPDPTGWAATAMAVSPGVVYAAERATPARMQAEETEIRAELRALVKRALIEVVDSGEFGDASGHLGDDGFDALAASAVDTFAEYYRRGRQIGTR